VVHGYSAPLPFTDFPNWLANALGLNLIVGEALAVLIICLFFFIPMIWLKSYKVLWVVIVIPLLAGFTALGWLPVYTWILMAVFIAYMVSRRYGGPF
jgi:hypothetical protein